MQSPTASKTPNLVAAGALPSRLIPGALGYGRSPTHRTSFSGNGNLWSWQTPPSLRPRLRLWNASLSPRAVRNVLIVGAGPMGQELACSLEQDRSANSRVLGFIDEYAPLDGVVLGRSIDLVRIARSEFVDEIILTTATYDENTRGIIRAARANRIDVKLVPNCFGCNPGPIVLRKYGNVPVLTLSEERIPVFRLFVKRAIDIVLSAVGLLLMLPLLAIIGCAIKLGSPGPAVYRAPRLGLKGRRFLCFKFRTMVADADVLKQKLRVRNQRNGAFFKMADDPRVTGIGRILRRYSLDELPQLWNVLRGEMSLVGPRPHPIDDFERYELEDRQRLDVLPGLTGLWQVTARNDPSFDRNMALDREYIGRWSLGLDAQILWKTLAVVLRGEGV